MEDIEERNARILNEHFGENFFINYLRRRRVPLTITRNQQIYSILGELRYLLGEELRANPGDDILRRVRRDIEDISMPIPRVSNLRRAANLLRYLGVTYDRPVSNRTQQRSLPNDPDKTETVDYKKDLSGEYECPICLDLIKTKAYYTEKCKNYFHKKCLDRHCLRKMPCECPICRRVLNITNTFSENSTGGKKKRTLKKCHGKKQKKQKKQKTYKKHN